MNFLQLQTQTLRLLLLPLFCFFLVFQGAAEARGRSHELFSPIKVKVLMKKGIFTTGEPVTGKVILINTHPSNLSAVFNVTIFHNKALVHRAATEVPKVPQGTTAFSFKKFGIPKISGHGPMSGLWRIVVLQEGLEPKQAAEAEFQIVPERKNKR